MSHTSHEKGTKHINTSAANLLRIKIGNLNWYKYGHWKNEAREIDHLCYTEVVAMLVAFAKIPECVETSHHRAFTGNCPTISHMC